MKVSPYLNSNTKRLLDLFFSLITLIVSIPFFIVVGILVIIFSGSPVFFIQERSGKKGKIFKILKFRTMIPQASKIQDRYKHLNQSDGPTFKIYNDPRFTRIGYKLSRSGLDELPQFINVLKGEMSIVGPRPLPVNEYKRLSTQDKVRNLVTPGITSLWVVNGSHQMKFKKWMDLDKKYLKEASLKKDLEIIFGTLKIIFRSKI